MGSGRTGSLSAVLPFSPKLAAKAEAGNICISNTSVRKSDNSRFIFVLMFFSFPCVVFCTFFCRIGGCALKAKLIYFRFSPPSVSGALSFPLTSYMSAYHPLRDTLSLKKIRAWVVSTHALLDFWSKMLLRYFALDLYIIMLALISKFLALVKCTKNIAFATVNILFYICCI